MEPKIGDSVGLYGNKFAVGSISSIGDDVVGINSHETLLRVNKIDLIPNPLALLTRSLRPIPNRAYRSNEKLYDEKT